MSKNLVILASAVFLLGGFGCGGNTGTGDGSGDGDAGLDGGTTGDTGDTDGSSGGASGSTGEGTSTGGSGSDTGDGTGETGTGSDTEDTVEACEGDLGCPEEQFCDAGECVDDVCDPDELKCEDGAVVGCAANGSGEESIFTCESGAYFESVCTEESGQAACGCEDDWDCPAHTICEAGQCAGTGVEPTCSLPPEPFENVLPSVEIEWGGKAIGDEQAEGSPFPESAQVVMSPIVANLDDDNGDGLINERDFPEIIFATFCNSVYKTDGVLRAIHGGGPNKGGDYFATCGSVVWHEGDDTDVACDCSDADLNSTASLAVGDLDRDGTPEIVAVPEDNDGIVIFSNTGEIISRRDGISFGYSNSGPSLADLDNAGFSEIIIGRHVLTLEKNEEGKLVVLDHFEGKEAHGEQGQGPVSCVANIVGDQRQEIIAATSVYRLPNPPQGVTSIEGCTGSETDDEEKAFCEGELITVWNGRDVNDDVIEEGFCAIADVWGADHDVAPGPDNPLDGTPEVITVSDGEVQIFEGETGLLIRRIDLDAGSRGGAPNVDDFDGDGFPEIASAFSAAYIVVDLQDPTTECPVWTAPFSDADDTDTDTLQGNPPRAEGCLHNGWQRSTEDNSSRVTGSSVFDFNGDGAAEVVYNDECYFRIYDGTDGQILFKEHSPSRTRIEYPIVADVDNDGNAEIVFGASNESGFCSEGNDYNNGIEVWGDASDTWVSARRIWNQHAYHVTNVLEDGRVPLIEPESWKSYAGRGYNTYRSNPRSYGVAPDLEITGMQVSSPNAKCGTLSDVIEITVRVENKGDLRIGPGVVVGFYGIWDTPPRDKALLMPDGVTPITFVLQTSLEPGDVVMLSVTYDVGSSPTGALPDRVRAVADDGDQERECREGNNSREAVVEPGEALADLVVEITEVDDSDCPPIEVTVKVRNEGSAPAEDVVLVIYAGDPEQGGKKIYEVVISGTLAADGSEKTVTASISEFPANVKVEIYAVVDPDDKVEECNDGNNSDQADSEAICSIVI